MQRADIILMYACNVAILIGQVLLNILTITLLMQNRRFKQKTIALIEINVSNPF